MSHRVDFALNQILAGYWGLFLHLKQPPQHCPSTRTLLALTGGVAEHPPSPPNPSYFTLFQSIPKRGFRALLFKPNLRSLPHPYRSDVICLHLDVVGFSCM